MEMLSAEGAFNLTGSMNLSIYLLQCVVIRGHAMLSANGLQHMEKSGHSYAFQQSSVMHDHTAAAAAAAG